MTIDRSDRDRSAEEVPPATGWLVRNDQVLASVEVARGRVGRARGLLGRDHLEGAMYIEGCRSVHSFAMGFELDVAFLDKDMEVIRTLRLRRGRVTLPVLQARSVLEAEAGAFGRWDLKVGDVLEIRRAASSDD
ncbi:MAG: DUF192 domain-containing protein [Actinomycetota bacterium]